MVAAFAVLPVALMGSLYGVRAGLLAGLLAFPLNVLLVAMFAGPARHMVGAQGLIGSLLVLLVGAILGRMRDLGERAKRDLAERRQAESQRDAMLDARRESEERYRSLFESTPVGIYVTTPAGQILDANPAILRMLGYPDRDSLLTVNAEDNYVNVEDRRRWQAVLERNGMVRDFECRFRRRDGTVIWVETSARTIRSHDGSVLYYEGSLKDVTARVEAQSQRDATLKALQRERDRAQTYLDVAGVMLVALDEKGEITLMNRRGHQILEYEEGELVGRNWFDACLPAHTREETSRFFQRLMAREVEPGETHESPILTASGEERIVAWRNTTLTDGTGKIIGTLSSGEDMTERASAEAERDATLAALSELNVDLEGQVETRTAEIRAEKEKSETILSSAGDAIALTDLDLRVQYVNQAFTTLTGYAAEEMLGQSMTLLRTDALVERDRQSMAHALARGEVWQGDITIRRKDGRPYEAAMTIAPVFDAQDRLVGHVCSHQDISGRVELDRARARFMTNVSHELRTPLTNLQLYAQLLREGRRPEKAERYHQVLQEQAKRLGDLIQDMLEMATLDGGKAMEAWKPVSLPTLVGDAVNRYQDQATAAGLTLLARPVPAGLRAVQGDPARLGQALAEVVENAVTFTPAGGQVTVEVSAAEDEGQDWAIVSVRDTGPGISAEEQERVFDRFFRGTLAESGHVPGTGLGLSMAQEILRAHGGRITVESELGEGAAFKLWLRS
jgi:PAS domain S-box-containing protein